MAYQGRIDPAGVKTEVGPVGDTGGKPCSGSGGRNLALANILGGWPS